MDNHSIISETSLYVCSDAFYKIQLVLRGCYLNSLQSRLAWRVMKTCLSTEYVPYSWHVKADIKFNSWWGRGEDAALSLRVLHTRQNVTEWLSCHVAIAHTGYSSQCGLRRWDSALMLSCWWCCAKRPWSVMVGTWSWCADEALITELKVKTK